VGGLNRLLTKKIRSIQRQISGYVVLVGQNSPG
jgi:hypothetical protein